jgi:cardiolipin synthase A/B
VAVPSFSTFFLAISLAYMVWAIIASVGLIMQRRSPPATLGWMLALVFLPYVGALIYLFFGPRRLARKRLRYAAVRQAMARATAKVQTLALPEQLSEDVRTRYRQLARLAQRLGQPLPSRAGSVTVFHDGDACYHAMHDAIANARDHIHIEYYIWAPGEAADRVRDALIERARAGVKVRVLLDDVGSADAGEGYFKPLRDARAEVAWFNQVRLSHFRPTLVNFRTHRKIVICDGLVGFTGGMNLSDVHSNAVSGAETWRDTHLRITGAPVASLQRLFLENWLFATGDDGLLPSHFPPPPREANGPSVQIIGSGPDDNTHAIHKTMFTAITSARESIFICTPYFVPDESVLAALSSAALRGVGIALMVPVRGDSLLVTAAAESYFDELARVGVEIYQYGPPMLHAKTMVVDNYLALVGTANLDNRSFRLNFEVLAVVYDAATASALMRAFQQDLLRATRYRPASLKRRPWPRFLGATARLFSPIL